MASTAESLTREYLQSIPSGEFFFPRSNFARDLPLRASRDNLVMLLFWAAANLGGSHVLR